MELSEDIKKRLREVGAMALYLFGSRAVGKESAISDFDFALLMKDPQSVASASSRQALYLALYDILTDAIGPQPTEPVLDIVFLQAEVSLELKAHIVSSGRLLLDDDPNTRANFEACIMTLAADMHPVVAAFDRAILQRI